MGKILNSLISGYFLVIILFEYLPIFSVVLYSFNSGSGLSFPPVGFSTLWYSVLFNNPQEIGALIESIQLGLITMAITTPLTILTGISFRRRPLGRSLLFYLILLGMLVPGLIYGLGAGIFYKEILHINFSIWTAVPVEVLWTLPFGLILMLARFDPDLLKYENAARTLGATEGQIMRQVTLPLVFPHIIAVALFSFTLSFGELIRSIFVISSPPTLPVYIFSTVSNEALTPDFYALGTITIATALVLMVAAGAVLLRSSSKTII
jgi:putative spermidine/putrescine transport system permease protein